MNLNVYSIFDKAVRAYMRPFFMRTDAEALRAFVADIRSEDSMVGKHPEDYSLFRIGEFDGEVGVLTGTDDPRCLGRAHELVQAEPGQALKGVANA